MSRRTVLRGAAGAGAAGLAAATVFGGVASAATAAAPAARVRTPDAADERGQEEARQPTVIHVREARDGEIDVYRGTNHTRIRDRQLAAKLAGIGR